MFSTPCVVLLYMFYGGAACVQNYFARWHKLVACQQNIAASRVQDVRHWH